MAPALTPKAGDKPISPNPASTDISHLADHGACQNCRNIGTCTTAGCLRLLISAGLYGLSAGFDTAPSGPSNPQPASTAPPLLWGRPWRWTGPCRCAGVGAAQPIEAPSGLRTITRKGGSAAQMVYARGLDCVTIATVFLGLRRNGFFDSPSPASSG